MKTSVKIEQAKERAKELHAQQLRKNGDPYFEHLFAVADIVSEYTNDEEVIIAAFLHDTLEDVKNYQFKDLEKEFGNRVARIVDSVSDVKGDFMFLKGTPIETRPTLIEKYLATLIPQNLEKIKAGGVDAAIVAAADKINNVDCLIAGLRQFGTDYLNRFKQPIHQKVQFYKDVAKIVERATNCGIAERLNGLISNLEKELDLFNLR